ncbi:MAG: ATP-binding protein [Anaerolineae bacterium]|nr:ATP-binding protein [Anaerolineae bacterium]
MTDAVLVRANEVLSALYSDDPEVQRALQVLGDAIKVGNISGSTGVAVGRNIRQVVNNFPNLTTEQVALLLELRSALMGLDAEKYKMAWILEDKTKDFTGREHVFQAIDSFLANHSSGYLIMEGEPGLGKSAILAEYVRRTNCIAHFNVRGQGIVRASQFLEHICAQLIADRGLPYPALPTDATQDGAFLEKLLREAMKAQPGEPLIIAVDALDEADLEAQGSCSNLLCLPPVLPEGVYFIMTKRPNGIDLVAQAPQVPLDLMNFPAENRNDVERYLGRCAERPQVQTWIERQKEPTTAAFVRDLADLSENNFMYLRFVVPEIETGHYRDQRIEELPFGLENYYRDHWKRMGMQDKPLPKLKIRIVYILSEVRQPVSMRMIYDILVYNGFEVDPIEVQDVLTEWRQFLDQQPASDGTRWSVYHASFRDFLNRQEIIQAAGVTIQGINELIADYLWAGLFGDQGGVLAS